MRFRRNERGQSVVEFALALPLIMLLVLGVTDFARVFYYEIEMSGAVRAGVREAIIEDTTDIGDAVRSEPNSAIANTAAVWGATAAGGVNGNCTSSPGSQSCGDPSGCPPTVFSGTRVACFAVRACTLSGVDSGTCTSYGPWGSRPTSTGSGVHGIQVIVAYRFAPVSSVVTHFLPGITNGIFLVKQTAIGDELYF